MSVTISVVTADETIRVDADSSRSEIQRAIDVLRVKQRRMPDAPRWADRRREVGDQIDELVLMWLVARSD